MAKVTAERVAELLPEVELIGNGEWREKVIAIWQEAVEMSRWETMDQVKFNALCPGASLVSHTRAVTRSALSMLEAVRDFCGAEFSRDVIVVECLLHDVCKTVENDPGPGDRCVKSPVGKTYQHGFLSGYLAQKHGLPPEIVASLIAHTSHSKVVPSTLEGMFLFYADMACADMYRFQAGAPLKLAEFK